MLQVSIRNAKQSGPRFLFGIRAPNGDVAQWQLYFPHANRFRRFHSPVLHETGMPKVNY
jgi:hypothetical protein